MRQLFIITIFCFGFFVSLFAQTATLKGVVKDGSSGELLESATVLQPPANGVITDAKGNYELKVNAGNVTLIVSYIGRKSDTLTVTVKEGETKVQNIALGGAPAELEQVVINESRIAVKIQKVTQSVDVIKPRMLESNNITNLQQAVLKIPGVTMLDGQMSIRGGSGYAYGTGSRVVLVVDEMPLMTPDRGEIKWAFIPTENVEQMEVVKGSSVVQYGSFALNGALNVTTAYARDTPNTRFSFFYEGVGRPKVDSFGWWKRNGKFFESPNTIGFNFLHKQKFGDVDFVFGGMMQGSQSHLYKEYDYFARFNNKIRWKPKNLKRLTLELSSNVLYRKSGFQFYWQDGGHPYVPAGGVDLAERYFYAYVDPKFRFIDKGNNEHKIYGRMYRQKNLQGTTNFWVARAEYRFRHDFGKLVTLNLGVNNEHAWVVDGTLGTHQTDFGGGFATAELNWKWLTINAGVREEYYRLDSAITPTLPVFRAGVNFEIRKYNYIRASFGQSFRVPSIAERFVTYTLGSINIIPNYDIKPEKGFTFELGYKRSFKIGNFKGYWDAVAFWTEFRDMIEFQFGAKTGPDGGLFVYFQSQNVSKARIFGWETSLAGEGKIGPVDMSVLLGYTYFYGVDLNDSTYGVNKRNNNIGLFMKDAFTHFTLPTAKDDYTWDSVTAGMLKYRNPHTFKADFDFLLFGKYRLGTSMQYYSYMTNIDKIFEIFIPGIGDERIAKRNHGDFIWDLRAGYEINKNISFNFLVKNVLNTSYSLRVARPDKPRSFTVQLNVNFGGRQANTPKASARVSGY